MYNYCVVDEKVQLANQIHDLVYRYVRKLDQELHKFKMELEADHIGITEILEKRKYTMKYGVLFNYDTHMWYPERNKDEKLKNIFGYLVKIPVVDAINYFSIWSQ